MKLHAEFTSKEISITGNQNHSIRLHEIPILDKKKEIYTRGDHPVVLVRINLFIIKLQSNYRQHKNIQCG